MVTLVFMYTQGLSCLYPCEFELSVNYFLPDVLHPNEWVDVLFDVVIVIDVDVLVDVKVETLIFKIYKVLGCVVRNCCCC